MRKQVELENAIAAELAGSKDAVLRALEGHLDCDVFLRGNVLTLEGERISAVTRFVDNSTMARFGLPRMLAE